MPGCRVRSCSSLLPAGLFVCLFVVAHVPAAYAQTLRLPWTVTADAVDRKAWKGRISFEFPGSVALQDEHRPRLPLRRLEILIPPDRSVSALRWEGGTVVDFGPAQGLLVDEGVSTAGGERVFERAFGMDSARTRSVAYPPVELRSAGASFWRGYRIARIEVFPLRIDGQGRLRFHEGGELVVELGPRRDPVEPVVRRVAAEGWWRDTRRTLRQRVANPEALAGYPVVAPVPRLQEPVDARAKAPALGTSPVRHLIITTDALRSEFERLAVHRTESGLRSLVVTVEEILANYTQGLDLAETVRDYIRRAYQSWGVDYVLLGGDAELIPPRYAHSTYYPSGGSTDIPADLYFAALDGNWNADGDAYFGEHYVNAVDQGDYADFDPEVAVGRAPVTDLAQAKVFVDKILAYEKPATFNWQDRVLMASEVLFPSEWSSGQAISLDGAVLSEGLIDSAFATCGGPFQEDRYYENDTVWAGSAPETRSAVVGALGSGAYGLFHHIGHGFYFNMSVGDASLVPSDADALQNAPNFFVLYSLNCSSSAFDFDCLNERFLQNPNGGSVLSVGSARAAFPVTASVYQEEFYEQWLCDGNDRVGDAIASSRAPFTINTFFNTGDRWTHLVYTLLGDPATRLWSSRPAVASVSAPAQVGLGRSDIVVQVSESTSGVPLAGVTVTLLKGTEDYAVGTTDAAGQVTLSFAPETVGDLRIVVSGGNVVPQEITVPVVDAGAAFVAVQGLSISDDASGASLGNANGLPEGGERIEITPLWSNGTTVGYTGGSAVLRSSDPWVTLVDSMVTIPPLAAGVSGVSTDAFVLDLDPNLPDAHELHLFVLPDGGGANDPTDEEVLLLAAPELEVVAVRFDDSVTGNGNGALDAFEEVEVYVELRNLGTGSAQQVSGTLVSLDPAGVVLDAATSWSSLSGPLSRIENAADPLRVREDSLPADVEYALTVVDAAGRVVVHRFDLEAPAVVGGVGVEQTSGTETRVTWTPSTEADLRGYLVFRRLAGAPSFAQVSADVVEGSAVFLDRGVPPLSDLEYSVAAVDSGGMVGPLSPPVPISTSPSEILCFPLPIGLESSSDLAIGPVDGDGVLDMVIGAEHLYIVDGACLEKADGDGVSQTIGPVNAIEGRFGPAAVTLAQLSGSPGMEIVAHDRLTRLLYVFDGGGNVLPGWPVQLQSWAWASPVVGDLDADGDLEIVTCDIAGYTYAFHHDGTEVADGDANPATIGPIAPRRRQDVGGTLYTESFGKATPALYDVDGDGALEILFGSKYQNNAAPEYFYALKTDGTGGNAAGFPLSFPPRSEFLASPTVADLDQDGVVEIIQPCENDSLYVFEPDGSRKTGFPIYVRNDSVDKDSLTPSVAVGDFTEDGRLEMVVVSIDGTAITGEILLIDADGQVLPGWPVPVADLSESSPVVGDLDGDTHLDVLFGVGGGNDDPDFLYGFDRDGQEVPGFPIPMGGFVRGTPTLADLDGDGRLNIAVAAWDRLVHVWDLDAPYDPAKLPWPTFRGNVNRTGVFATEIRTDAPPSSGRSSVGVLLPATPNPFNPRTRLAFELSSDSGDVRLELFDLQGRRVRTLVSGAAPEGRSEAVWNGVDDHGNPVASGVYAVVLRVDGAVASVQKIALVK